MVLQCQSILKAIKTRTTAFLKRHKDPFLISARYALYLIMSIAFLRPTISISLGTKYRHASPAVDPTSVGHIQQSRHHGISHVDRDSAIALGVILILIFAAAAWYVHLRLKRRREADLEGQTAMGRNDRASGSDACQNSSSAPNTMIPSFRMDRLWSRPGRQDSVTTMQGRSSSQEKRFSWPGTLLVWSSLSTMATRVKITYPLPSQTLDERPHLHHTTQSRSHSPHSLTRISNGPNPTSPSALAPLPHIQHLRTS
jgi:hypothetical protein